MQSSVSNNNDTLDNSVVLITGALTGIGRATAFAFAKQGAAIMVSGRHADAGHALAASLEEMGAKAAFYQADVRIEEEVMKLVDNTIQRFGKLDIAVNTAGTEGEPGAVINQTAEKYAQAFDTNVLGTLLCMKHELIAMISQGKGSIVNISSVYGKIGGANASVYAASKHAVEGLTKSAALEVASIGIRVNAVAPGPVQTGMLDRFTGGNEENKKRFLASNIPLGRAGSAEEIADTIVFIGSSKVPYLTGQSIVVDGGKLA